MTFDWILEVPTSIWGSLLAGTMTLIGVILGQYLLRKRVEKQTEAEIDALRKALISELRAADEVFERLLYIANDIEKAKEMSYAFSDEYTELFDSPLRLRLAFYRYLADQERLQNDVYQGNVNKIGQLDSETARGVVEAYDIIDRLNNSLQNFADTVGHEELYDSDMDWSNEADLDPNVILYKEQIETAVTRGVILQKIALFMLGDDLSNEDRTAITFALSYLDPQTQGEAQIQEKVDKIIDKINYPSINDLS